MNRYWLQVLCTLTLLIVVSQAKYSPKGKRVCIIGAGVAGLVSTSRLLNSSKPFHITVFEKNSGIGGQWVYSDRTDVDQHGFPVSSNVYKYMRTNAPKQLMVFPDYPNFRGENRSYVRHEYVLQYLKNYTAHFGLGRFVKFNTNVEKVRALPHDKWHFQLRDLNTNKTYDRICDATIVGTGNFHEPNIPKIEGLSSFPGRVIHSKSYRVPEIYANQTVLVLGASFSGLDIAFELSHYSSNVYLSHRHGKLGVELPSNTIEVPGVAKVEGNVIILSDGQRVKVDAVILCTGYLYSYPPLAHYAGISVVQGKYVRSLYKQIINVRYPTMAILGLPHPGFPFYISYIQAEYFVAVLDGRVKLPCRADMYEASKLPKGVEPSQAHLMLPVQALTYYNGLAVEIGDKPVSAGITKAVQFFMQELLTNPLHFKEKNFYIYDNDTVLIQL